MDNTAIYLLQYNNYYNRLVKVEDTISDYMSYVQQVITNVNFNPNDQITTEHIFNVDDNLEADYCVIFDDGVIKSRWFIIEKVRIRGGQWRYILYRDVIADYYNLILNAPCFIEKAYLPYNSPLIFNSEDIRVNQIKTRETQLKDESGCAWIVGYYAKNATDFSGSILTNSAPPAIYIGNSIESWDYYRYSNLAAVQEDYLGEVSNVSYNIKVFSQLYANKKQYTTNVVNGATAVKNISGSTPSYQVRQDIPTSSFTNAFTTFGLSNLSYLPYIPKYQELNEIDFLLGLNNKVIYDSRGRYFVFNIFQKEVKELTAAVQSGALYNNLTTVLNNAATNYYSKGQPNKETFSISYKGSFYSIVLTEEINLETRYNIPVDRLKTIDAPYDIFAIPYGELKITDALNSQFSLKTNKELGMAAAAAIQAQEGVKIYDIQLLPYCPIPELIYAPNQIQVTAANQYSLITKTNKDNSVTNYGIIFNVPRSSFSLDIQFDIYGGTSAMEKKLINQCDLYRLVSPNYNGSFDFNPAKNNGVEYFNVDCTYKPYSPYIHVNPNFKGLYGSDFNDPRGLVCGGDFSLAGISDSWVNYQIQNKTFQENFDRQIQTFEIQNSLQKEQDIYGAVAGTVTGTASGAMSGAMSGGVWGAVVGGIVGGAASAFGGVRDIQINERLRKDALDLSKDQFGYQLMNIQALPYSLTKVSAFNLNNKVFPILEYYTCTEEEREAVKNKIIYNGMTVMTIGTINDYIPYSYTNEFPAFIKGKLIRLDTIKDDTHLIDIISREIFNGLYFGGN